MDDVEQQFSRHLRGQGGLRLVDVRSRLQPYVNGLAGRELPLIAADAASTDSESIFLPSEIGLFSEHEENFLLYKLMVSFQWASLEAGTFAAPRSVSLHKKSAHPLDCFFSDFLHPANARSLYHFLETSRVLAFLRQDLPGLMRDAAILLPKLPLSGDDSSSLNLLDRLQQGLLRGQWPVPGQSALDDRAVVLLQRCQGPAGDNEVSLEAVRELMPLLAPEESLAQTNPLVFQGNLRLQEMRNLGMKQQTDKELRLMKTMTAKLPSVVHKVGGEDTPQNNAGGRQGQDAAVIIDMDRSWEQLPPFFQSQSQRLDISEMTVDATKPDQEQHRHNTLTEHSVSATEGKAGQAFARSPHSIPGEGQEMVQPVVYDEWDYRRKGFRKNWCVVTEKVIPPVQNTFIEQTLKQYRGQIRRLRHQFELLQTSERFVRRQREGSDIDLDAMIESLADNYAGRPPSDRLFIRLARDQRDIAVYFLVDMSNSTAGWVGQSIKEALVLICEAMEVLNDRYGIYGFSGMRRLRCEVFPVKRIDDRYTREVRQRISAIGPREYTRMAPAIRHMTSLFSQVEAKIRLLIVLSDGKPEDYDDYKGDYAIEDTRHALIEAKVKGVHPFCITIDRQAHEYMAHMYGEVNYIFIDKVKQLPARMAEIYRSLTS
jgi:nitric oxide reductase NorD protein